VRCRYDRLGREAEGHQEVLQGLDAVFHAVHVAVLDGVRELTEVRADGEVAVLVADDEADDVVAIQRRERPVAHLDRAGVYGVSLGVEFQAQNAVAEVEQARRVVAFEFFALVPQPV
jgi:hypothetical protein